MKSPGFTLLMALRLAAHRSVGGGPSPASRPRWRGAAAAVAVLLTLSPLACGDDTSSAEKAARGACSGLTRDDLRPEADRMNFLRAKEQLAAQAANGDPRYDDLYDARRDVRQATEDHDSKAAVVAGLRLVKECHEITAG